MQATTATSVPGQSRALWMSTIAFTVCFAVWTIFAIIGIQIKQQLGLNETQFGLLVGTPILTGSLVRIFLGIWTDQYRRPPHLHGGDAGGCARDVSADLRPHLSANSRRRARRRHCRRFLRGRHRLRVALVSGGEAGNRARHFRRRQCRRGGDQVLRAIRAGRLWLADNRASVGRGHRHHGRAVLVLHQGRPGGTGAPRQERTAAQHLARARAAEERPGLALRPLLFLYVRRLRRAVVVAAALPDRRLQARHRDRRHAGRRLFDSGELVPHLWRRALRPLWRAPHHVLDVRRLGADHLHPGLSAHRICRAVHQWPAALSYGDWRRHLHLPDFRARLLHEPGQSRGLQAHPRLLPG